jgi:uncharacterized caspase-like protein
MVLLFRALAVAFAVVAATVPAMASKKVALVIGNGAYTEAPLKNPTNDARAVAAKLRQQGFDVVLRENATKAQMNDVVADFGEKLSEGDTALFFFAGHGIQVQGRNYLIPTDARITSEQRVRLETLDVEAVLDQMAAARVSVSMVILDACRNNPFERRFRSVGGGLAQISAPEGTMIAYATAPGKVAADGEGSNGLYTQELLKALSQPGLKVEDVFKQVRIGVARASGGSQVPWEASSLTGDFYFQPPVAVAAPAPVVVPPLDREAIFWDSVKLSSDPAELRAYLDAFPSGLFAGIARARVANLETARQSQVAAASASVPVSTSAPAVAASTTAVPAQAPQQIAAAAPVARTRNAVAGLFTATVPVGVLVSQSAYTFLQVEQGTVRFSASEGGGTTGRPDFFVCTGEGELDASGAFSNVEISCRVRTDVSKTLASGTLTTAGQVQVKFEATNGKKAEILFR